MRLKLKYIIFIATLLLTCLVLSYFIFEEHKLLFILSELLIIACALIAISLYKQLIQPLINLQQGITAIKDQDFNVKFRPTGQREVDELVEVYNHMIDALRIERTAQQEQHFFLEKLIQTSPTAIIIMDFDEQFTQANPKAAEMLADTPGLGDQLSLVETGGSKTIRIDGVRTFKIQKSKFIDRGFERRFIMMEEVTAEIFEAEKNVYSKVIRMMAHEVNNTVGPVNSILNSALDQKHLWIEESDQLLRNALQVAIERNQNLNGFIRNFAELVKLPVANLQPLDLITLLRSLLGLMQYVADERQIRLALNITQTSYLLLADLQQLEQALINILKNALESIGRNGNVKIELYPEIHTLKIIDDGPGISNADRELMFSPFYSTKKDGQGIGLTLVREIFLNHGYQFSLRTVAPGHTEFNILLK
jgi:two-component system nitrogen regulation sensor histidine kinase NtrY